MPRRYSKIKSNDIVTEVDSRSKEHSFRLNLISKIFCSSLMIMLLIGGIGAQALSNQGAYAQEFQEDDVSVPEDSDANSENVVTDEGGVSIAEICGDNIDNDGDGQMDDSDLEGCIPAYEETVTEGETTTTGTGVEEGVSIADICGDNIDNDADGQLDDLDPEGCVPNDKIYNTEELMELGDKIHDKLIALANTVGAPEPGTTIDETEFHNAVIGFSDNLKRQVLDSVRYSEPMPIPLKITLESLRLWINDPGDQWGEGSWDSNDLDMSATCYVTVPASQYKCNAYVAEAIFLATGVTFPVYESEEEPGKYFPYRAKDWGDTKKTIPHFVIVNNPQMGDVWSNGSHNGIYLGEYNGVKLYISARDDGEGVYGLDSV
ncbi:MAG TPA: hypothetical protein VFY68_15685, partial [Nitrososphaeraceae archaeon]|nr:hypothetical protein [Nitrososphaeraceae archaeon]